MGFTGPTGPEGHTGPIGPKAMCLKSFLRIYNDVPQSIELNDPILFNKNDIVVGPIAHVLGSGDVLLGSVGYYQVIGKIYHLYSIQVGLFLNGVLLVGSVVGQPATTSTAQLHDIVRVGPADLLPNPDSPTGVAAVLQIRNHISYVTPILLDGREGAGSDTTQANASFMIMQICDEVEEERVD
jgi:hypothetical protein